MKLAILPAPPQSGFLRICRSCNRWFALELIEVKNDPVANRIRVERCKYCSKEAAFAERRPPECL